MAALGSYSIMFGSLGNATPYDFIKEVQVKTGGYEAEFGQATGGVVNVITKSGTNQFSGSAFGYAQPIGLEASWTQYQSTNGSVNTTVRRRTATSASKAGGPVVRDRLFFFGAIDPALADARRSRRRPGFPLASLGEVDRATADDVLCGERRPCSSNSAHRIDASFFGDPSHGDIGPAADVGAARPDRHVRLQRARLRRPPADRAL